MVGLVSLVATRARRRECIEAIAETADKEWNFYFKLKPKEEMYKRNITFDEGDRKRVEILLARFAYRNTTASTASKEKALAQDDAPVPKHHSLTTLPRCLVGLNHFGNNSRMHRCARSLCVRPGQASGVMANEKVVRGVVLLQALVRGSRARKAYIKRGTRTTHADFYVVN